MSLPISAIILTYNEENTINACIESIKDLAEDIFVVDSYSNDKTLEILKEYQCKIFQNKFKNWSKQRNWALENLPIKTDWVLHLDADHRVTSDLKNELIQIFSSGEDKQYTGFLISRKTIFMNRWIKHGGHYPVYHAVLFKRGLGKCEDAIYDQHFIVSGKLKVLCNDIEDHFTESLSSFIEKHNKWAKFEAVNHFMGKEDRNNRMKGNLHGNPAERRRYFKNLYFKFPIFIRPVFYFTYRFFIQFGFLDGIPGIIFHFMQGFWFRFLVDCRICEIQFKALIERKDVQIVAKELST